MKIDLRKLSTIRPYERNPRLNDDAVEAVCASLREFGFRQPIVVDQSGVIVVGHTRYKAALKLGLERVPVHVAKDLSPEQIRAYRIADNKSAEGADWDYELLPIELAELQELNVDLGLLGFTSLELAELLGPDATAGLTDPDDVPAPPAKATTRPGDLIVLGNHRLLCGDSSQPADLDRLLDGLAIHLVNTDPPYNVKVEPRSNNAIAAGLSSFGGATHHQQLDAARKPGKTKSTHKQLRPKDRPLANDFVSEGEFDRLLAAWFGNLARVLQPGRAFYIWGGYANCANYPPAMKAAQLYFSQAIIWVKGHPVLTRKDFMGNHEWCFYGWREGAAHQFFGEHNLTDVWEFSSSCQLHAPAVSPDSGVSIGSGSTLMAAETEGRRAFLCELDPLYCDVIVARWEQFTGRKAERPQTTQPRSPGSAGAGRREKPGKLEKEEKPGRKKPASKLPRRPAAAKR